MNEIVLPKIEHAKVTLNERGRVVIRMDDGWRFWRRNNYLDENGEMREPTPAELVCARFGVFSPTTDFSLFVVIAESDIPKEPETEPQATE